MESFKASFSKHFSLFFEFTESFSNSCQDTSINSKPSSVSNEAPFEVAVKLPWFLWKATGWYTAFSSVSAIVDFVFSIFLINF